METLFFEKPSVIRREKKRFEQELNVTITIVGRKVTLEGAPLDEYVALMVLDALAFGFTPKEALTLKQEDTIFQKVPIKNFTRRKNLHDVRSRLIGTEGKTRRTIEEIADCIIVIGESAVGIIGPAAGVDTTIQGVVNLIRGTKQANTYRFLERINTERKKHLEGLGLKTKSTEEESDERLEESDNEEENES